MTLEEFEKLSDERKRVEYRNLSDEDKQIYRLTCPLNPTFHSTGIEYTEEEKKANMKMHLEILREQGVNV